VGPDGLELRLGRRRHFHLQVLDERWIPEHGGLLVEAREGDVGLSGYLMLRGLLVRAGRPERLTTGVELWIHAEAVDSRRARQILLRGRPRSVTSQATELHKCKIGITPFDCPRDNDGS
jgi:hypothetical protein